MKFKKNINKLGKTTKKGIKGFNKGPIGKGLGKGLASSGKGLGKGFSGLGKGLGSAVKTSAKSFQGITSTLTNPVFLIAAGAVVLFIVLKK